MAHCADENFTIFFPGQLIRNDAGVNCGAAFRDQAALNCANAYCLFRLFMNVYFASTRQYSCFLNISEQVPLA
jgi:hypothetical protein